MLGDTPFAGRGRGAAKALSLPLSVVYMVISAVVGSTTGASCYLSAFGAKVLLAGDLSDVRGVSCEELSRPSGRAGAVLPRPLRGHQDRVANER